ncbi:MAG: glycolate oxidase subunit GlcF [Halomonas subglaciescola]|nr:glycolate oxidase subunit GlcF [Halomonas subglaciescola]
MQTHFSDADRQKPHIQEAEQVLRTCVHCGFCNATCPTYQLLGDERDGPRGRIYLMKELLESPDDDANVTAQTRLHLDRCLTCLSCETTCPSGVEYHKLLNIGRAEIERRAPRPAAERLTRYGLRKMLVSPARFNTLLKLGQTFKPLVPEKLRRKMPPAPVNAGIRPAANRHPRRVLMLEGCAQQGLSPNTNAATARVLDRLGISVTPVPEAGCCGAIDFHLNAQQQARERMRANIDAWWPHIEQGAEAIVQTASGCGAFVKDYGDMLKDDPAYAERAQTVSARAKDIVEVLRGAPLETLRIKASKRLAFQCPCTLQHAQRLGGAVESVLTTLGFSLTAVQDGHLCCGSAGTYSITQPELATQLRDNKLNALEAGNPEMIVTANVGCQTHLASAGRTPVRHWIEVVDDTLV